MNYDDPNGNKAYKVSKTILEKTIACVLSCVSSLRQQVSAGLLKLWGAVGAVYTETPSETTISPNSRLNTQTVVFHVKEGVIALF